MSQIASNDRYRLKGIFILTLVVFIFIGTMLGPPLAAQVDWLSSMRAINPTIGSTFEIDEKLVKTAGIRKISSRHLDLYTDVRIREKVDLLPEVFDDAVDQWCEYFKIDRGKAGNWRIRAFLIADKNDPSRFRNAGLMPNDLPDFKAGFQQRHNLWLYLQPGNYYTRHLLIHEGTHAFMAWFLQGLGSPWYGEGMAELFGVHRWKDRKLQLLYHLRDRSEAEYWGRVKQIKQEHEAGTSMTLSDMLNIPPTAFLEVRYYAWSWAGCEFFSKHEKTREEFSKLPGVTGLDAPTFNQRFTQALQNNWIEIERDWELFVGEMEYGYDVQRGRVTPAQPLGARFGSSKSRFDILASQSWQMTDVKVEQGNRFRISGSGEFVVANAQAPRPWNSQSNGITIKYYRGQPLGMLQAGVLNTAAKTAREQVNGLLNPISIGNTAEFTAATDGILCLRINESPAHLIDNQDGLEVTVEKLE